MARPEKVRRVQELRRSSAARPHRNRKRYSRKVKHREGPPPDEGSRRNRTGDR